MVMTFTEIFNFSHDLLKFTDSLLAKVFSHLELFIDLFVRPCHDLTAISSVLLFEPVPEKTNNLGSDQV